MRRGFTNKFEVSILSRPASAQKSFCEAASMTNPFGHFNCPRTMVLWLLPSRLALWIFGIVPQSVQYINLKPMQKIERILVLSLPVGPNVKNRKHPKFYSGKNRTEKLQLKSFDFKRSKVMFIGRKTSKEKAFVPDTCCCFQYCFIPVAVRRRVSRENLMSDQARHQSPSHWLVRASDL